MSNNFPKESLDNSFEKLLYFIAEKKVFDQTKNLKLDHTKRIEKCIEIIKNDYSEAISLQADCVPDSYRMIALNNRKLEALQSLFHIAQII